MAYRTYSPLNGFIVNPNGTGDFTTITAAMAAVQAAITAGTITKGTIFASPATYTENFTFTPNTTLTSFGGCEDLPNVIINGKITFTAAGNYVIFGCEMRTNGDYALVMSGSNALEIQIDSCNLNALNNTFGLLTNSNSSSIIRTQYSKGNIATTGITLWDASTYGGRWVNNQIVISNTGASATRSVINGTFNNVSSSNLAFPITTTSTQFNYDRVSHSTFGINITPLIVSAGVAPIFNSELAGGNAPSLTINSPGAAIINQSSFNTSTGNVISGNGNINFNGMFSVDPALIQNTIVFIGGSNVAVNTLSIRSPLKAEYGGTGQSSYAVGDLLYASSTTALSKLPVAQNGDVLQLAAGVPTWSTPSFPITVGGSGTILRSNGTDWAASTATYPNTTTVNQLLYSSSANTIAGLPTANSSILVTSAGGVPSLSGTLPFTLPVSTGGTGATTLTGLVLGNGTSPMTAITFTPMTAYTPVLTFGGGSTGITYGTQVGYYTQIGNLKFVTIRIVLTNKGSSTGLASVSLPVAAIDTNALTCTTGNITYASGTYCNYTTASGGLIQATGSGVAAANLSDVAFANNSTLTITGVYY